MIWFTSDTHFGHANIIGFCSRPFANVTEMDRLLIEEWNSCVHPDDTVYHLGDFSFRRPSHTTAILTRLHGRKHLIRGNHDKQIDKWNNIGDVGFRTVSDYLKISAGNRTVIMCHYPIESWDGAHRGNIHLHGHSHGGMKTKHKGRLDVGVDCHNYRPISIDEVVDIIDSQPKYTPVDHHGENRS